jgi:hypothetical protein
MTGLLFCDHVWALPEGLPIHTQPIADRYKRNGFEVVIAVDGGKYVVAHWPYDNGRLDRLDRVQ